MPLTPVGLEREGIGSDRLFSLSPSSTLSHAPHLPCAPVRHGGVCRCCLLSLSPPLACASGLAGARCPAPGEGGMAGSPRRDRSALYQARWLPSSCSVSHPPRRRAVPPCLVRGLSLLEVTRCGWGAVGSTSVRMLGVQPAIPVVFFHAA